MVNGVDTLRMLRVTDHYPSLLVAVIIITLPFVTIFMYQQRKRQIRMSIMSIVAVGSFITLMLSRVSGINKLPVPPLNPSYGIGAVLPIVSLVFIVLAILGINKDEKLVKSMDRLR